MNKRLSLLIILISLFLLWSSHARAAAEDNEEVKTVTEGEHLEALSNVTKLKGQNQLLFKDNKRLEKQNGDYFVQNRQMTKEIETISRKGLAKTLFQQDEQGGLSSDISSFLSASNPFLTTAVQKEGGESLKLSLDRSSDFSSSSFLPQLQGSDSGGYLQELMNKIAEQEQVIKVLTQQLETYQNIQKTDQTPLSSSETHLSQLHHEGVQTEQFNSSVLETKHQEREESEKVSQEEETDTLSKLRIAFNKIRSFLIKDEEEREADVSPVKMSSSSLVQEDQQHLIQETAELRQRVTELSESNEAFVKVVAEKDVIIDQQKTTIDRQNEALVQQEEKMNEQKTKIEQQEKDLEDSIWLAEQQKAQDDEDFLVRINQQKLVLEQEQKKLTDEKEELTREFQQQIKKAQEALEARESQFSLVYTKLQEEFKEKEDQINRQIVVEIQQKNKELEDLKALIQQREEKLNLAEENLKQATIRIEGQQKTLEERQKERDLLNQERERLVRAYAEEKERNKLNQAHGEELYRQKITMIQQKDELLEEKERQIREQSSLIHQTNAEHEKTLENLAHIKMILQQTQEQYAKEREALNAHKVSFSLATQQYLKDKEELIKSANIQIAHLQQTFENKENEFNLAQAKIQRKCEEKDNILNEREEQFKVQIAQQTSELETEFSKNREQLIRFYKKSIDSIKKKNEKQLDEMKAQLHHATEEVNNHCNLYKKLQQENDELKYQVGFLQTALSTSKKEYEDMMDSIAGSFSKQLNKKSKGNAAKKSFKDVEPNATFVSDKGCSYLPKEVQDFYVKKVQKKLNPVKTLKVVKSTEDENTPIKIRSQNNHSKINDEND